MKDLIDSWRSLLNIKTEALQKYAQNPNANEVIIAKENDFLGKSYSIIDAIEDEIGSNLHYLAYWQAAEKQFLTLTEKDSEITGLVLMVQFKVGTANYTRINLNPFEQ